MRRRILFMLTALIAVALVGVTIRFLPPYLPRGFYEYITDPQPSEVLVVLGGDPRGRATRALELYEMGYAAKILVTGAETDSIAAIRAAVPESAILVEPSASSTWENASFSAHLIARELGQVSSLTIVTDWWHTRRASACFRQAFPDAKVISVSANPVPSTESNEAEVKRREFSALLYYAIKHRINPWAN